MIIASSARNRSDTRNAIESPVRASERELGTPPDGRLAVDPGAPPDRARRDTPSDRARRPAIHRGMAGHRAAAHRPGLETLIPLALLALAATAFIPRTHLQLHTTGDQIAVQTTATLISTIAALLFFDRFWRHLRRRDLLLAVGLAVNAASNLGTSLLLTNDIELGGHAVAWIVLGGRLAAWSVIAFAALTSDRTIRRPSRTATRTAARWAAALAGVAILAVLLSARAVSPETTEGPIGSATGMLIAQIVLVGLTGASAFALRRESLRESDSTTRLLTLACAFAAAAALANCAIPSFYASRVDIGDFLRLCWLMTLFACVCVEWSLDERRAALNALARERRRMAADVHDLIMQDLSFALANARALNDDPGHTPHANTVVLAGERALAGAREVVSELTGRETRPLAQTVEASVRAAARHTPLRFDALVPPLAQADEQTCEALVHIAREAVTNAVKHARPKAIEVVLERTNQWRLTVCDDGRGFDEAPAAPSAVGGFGLLSMRESAHALGGAVHVGSTVGVGTTVEAVLP